jgi:hypothetical protein
MKHFYSSLVLLLVASFGFAQNAELYGVVRDAETKDYLQGAAFKYAKMRGASSDASGRYTMSLPAGDYEFTVSYIGYKNEKYNITLAAGEKKELNVNMRPRSYSDCAGNHREPIQKEFGKGNGIYRGSYKATNQKYKC